MSNLEQKLETASFLETQKVKAAANYTTIMIKNEINDKLKDLAHHFKLPKTKVLYVIINDAYQTIIEGNNDE